MSITKKMHIRRSFKNNLISLLPITCSFNPNTQEIKYCWSNDIYVHKPRDFDSSSNL